MFLCSSVAFSIGLDIATEDDDDDLDPEEQANRELYKDLYALAPPVCVTSLMYTYFRTPSQVDEFKYQCEVILDTMPNLRTDIDKLLENPTSLGQYARYVSSYYTYHFI